LRQLLKEKAHDFQAVITHPTYALPFLNAGRLVEVRDGDRDFGWGVIIAYNKINNAKVGHVSATDAYMQGRPPVFTENDPPQKQYVVDVMVKLASGTSIPRDRSPEGLYPPGPGDSGVVGIIGVSLSTIQSISQIRVKLPSDLRSQGEKNTAYKAVGVVQKKMPDGPPLLDPIRNMSITDQSFKDLVKVTLDSQAEKLTCSKSHSWKIDSKFSPLAHHRHYLPNTISTTRSKRPSNTSSH
jgi:ATP-dependent RNA helicase DOB1